MKLPVLMASLICLLALPSKSRADTLAALFCETTQSGVRIEEVEGKTLKSYSRLMKSNGLCVYLVYPKQFSTNAACKKKSHSLKPKVMKYLFHKSPKGKTSKGFYGWWSCMKEGFKIYNE